MLSQMAFEVAALHAAMTSCNDSLSAGGADRRVLSEASREDLVEGVDHVLSRLLPSLALAVHARHFRDAGDDQAILIGLEDDGQIQRGSAMVNTVLAGAVERRSFVAILSRDQHF